MKFFESFSLARVPQKARMPFFGVALVHIGMLTALDQFMLGAVLGHNMSFPHAFLAITVGSIIFFIATFGLGYAGMREGISGSLLARWCGFGRYGSIIIGLLISISLVGWFGVQNAVFAQSIDFALGGKLGTANAAALSGLTLTFIVAFGFRALRFTAKIAVPAFAMSIIYISYLLLNDNSASELPAAVSQTVTLSVSDGITMVVGGSIVASLITPDLTRYYKNGRQVALMTLLTIFLGEYIINGIAIVLAVTLGTSDVVTIMSQAIGGVGLIVVILSTIRINDINIYSSSLGVINAIEAISGYKVSYIWMALCTGVLGTTLSVIGILERFVDFLNLLGILFPPVIGIMLLDYFILKSNRKELDISRAMNTLPGDCETHKIGWSAIFASLAGAGVGYFVTQGVPAINSVISGCLVYLMIEMAGRKIKSGCR